jgi:hypothetical protein
VDEQPFSGKEKSHVTWKLANFFLVRPWKCDNLGMVATKTRLRHLLRLNILIEEATFYLASVPTSSGVACNFQSEKED